MKKSYLLVFVLLLSKASLSQDDFNQGTSIAEAFCGIIQQEKSSENICELAIDKFPHAKDDLNKVCQSFLKKMNSDPDKAFKSCKEEAGKLFHNEGEKTLNSLMTPGNAPNLKKSEVVSGELSLCSEVIHEKYLCIGNPVVPSLPFSNALLNEITKIANQSVKVTRSDYSEATCDCLTRALKPEKFQDKIDKLKPEINKLMQEALGKKLINEFAANLEDVHFFKVNNHTTDPKNGTSMLGTLDEVEQFQCNDPLEFSEKIKEACGKNNVSSTEIKERLNNLLGAFGDFKNAGTLKEKFSELQEDILNVEVNMSVGAAKNKTKTFSRGSYDKYRFGRYKSHPEVQFLNKITDKLLDDKELGKIILENINKGYSPARAIFSMLKDKDNKRVAEILSDAYRGKRDNPFYQDLKKAIKSTNSDIYKEFIDNTTDLALDMHPGLKAIYKDRDLFLATRKISKESRRNSILEVLEKDPNLLKDHFRKRCENIQNSFTEAVCISDNDLVKRAKREDLNRLLTATAEMKQYDPRVKDLLLCQIPLNEEETERVFQNVAVNDWDRLRLSNYWERKNSSEGQANDRYSRMANALGSGDGSVAKAFASTSGLNDAFAFSNNDINKISTEVTKPQVPSKDRTIDLQNVTAGISNFSEAINPENDARQAIASSPTYINPIQPQTINNSLERNRDQEDPREILREFLSNEQNKNEVDKHLANIKDEDQRELLRLKEELASNRETMLKLMSELEQSKMKKLTEDFEKLEGQYKTGPQQVKAVEELSDSPYKEIVPQQFAQASSQVFSSPDTNREAVSFANTGGSQTASAGSGRTLASESSTLAPKSATTPETNFSWKETSNGEIMVTSTKVHEAGSLRTEDFSEEIMAFVKNNQPDIKTLKKLMSSGIILKINVRKNGIETQEEIKVDSSKLTANARKYLQDEIALKEYKEAQRTHSFSALKLLLSNKTKNSVN